MYIYCEGSCSKGSCMCCFLFSFWSIWLRLGGELVEVRGTGEVGEVGWGEDG